VSDIDTMVEADGLKALDPEWPIREATELLRRREMSRSATSGSTKPDVALLVRVGSYSGKPALRMPSA
jgi:hypothetical protein